MGNKHKNREHAETLHEIGLVRNYIIAVIKQAIREERDEGHMPNAEIALRTEQALYPLEKQLVELLSK